MKGKGRQNHLGRISIGITMITVHHSVCLSSEHIVDGGVGIDG